jgi:hemolysin activation/secretion protein
MTVAAPPPLTPEQGELTVIRREQEVGTIRFQSYRLHLLGAADVLSAGAHVDAMDEADTLSNAVRALAQAYYDAGYPGALLRYALDGEDLYIHIDLGTLTDVRAPDSLLPYFDDLPRGTPLTDRELEPRRTLADAFADRAGLYAETALVPVGEGRRLDISAQETDAERTHAKVAFGNPGNRFVGRYLLDIEASRTRHTGDLFKLLGSVGLSDLDDDARADEYYDATLTWSRVTPSGLFGLTGRVVDYKQPIGDTTIDGDLEEIQGTWSYPLAATLTTRWIFDARIDYTRKRREAQEPDLPLQNEQYPSLETGVDFTHAMIWLGKPWDFETGLTLRKGLRSSTAASSAETDYLLWRPSARASVTLRDNLAAGAAIIAQLTSDTVPEQSQWVLGGINAIYAYLPGVAVGDSGGLAQLQLEYRLPRFDEIEVRPRAFAEYGFVDYGASTPERSGGTVELADIGVEINARLRSWLEASLAGAVPVLDDDISAAARDDTDAGLLFRIAVSF